MLLFFIVAASPCFAIFTLVQDTAAIAQSAANWLKEAAQMATEVQKWTREAQRLMLACQKMATGDFSDVLGDIQDITDSLIVFTGTDNAFGNMLEQMGDTAAMTEAMQGMGQNLAGSLQDIWNGITNAGNAIGGIGSGNSWNEIYDSMVSGLGDISDSAGSIASATNSVANISSFTRNYLQSLNMLSTAANAAFLGEDSALEKLKEQLVSLTNKRGELTEELMNMIQEQSDGESVDPTIRQRLKQQEIDEVDRQIRETKAQIAEYEQMKVDYEKQGESVDHAVTRLYNEQMSVTNGVIRMYEEEEGLRTLQSLLSPAMYQEGFGAASTYITPAQFAAMNQMKGNGNSYSTN